MIRISPVTKRKIKPIRHRRRTSEWTVYHVFLTVFIILFSIFGIITIIRISNPTQPVQTPILRAAAGAFRFISMGDTKGGTGTLATLSNQAKGFSPAFLIYPGDLVDSGFSQGPMNIWKAAMNGNSNNGLADITFPVRGNHDSANVTGWQGFFDVAGMVTRVGGTNHNALSDDLTYSFDYGNSHIVGIDVTGNASRISIAQVNWLDGDLSAAEARGLTHAFIFFHGPIYYVDNHSGAVPLNLIAVLNKHPIVTATFHGHEHVYAYVNMNSSRVPQITRPFAQFVTGNAGASSYNCAAGRSDYCANFAGFAVVDVNGETVTVSIYQSGRSSPAKTVTLIKSGNPVTPQPTSTIQPTDTQPAATTRPTTTTRPQASPTPPLPGNTIPGDINKDNVVNALDYVILFENFQMSPPADPRTDINGDGVVNALDYVILFENFGKTTSASTPTPTYAARSSSTFDQVLAWVEAYKAVHPGKAGDITYMTPAKIDADTAAKQLASICGSNQRPVIPILSWEYGGNDHPWINPQASALVYCVYIPVSTPTEHWKYDAAQDRVTADVYVLFPDQNPCKNRAGKDQVIACLGDPTNSEILVDTASLHDGMYTPGLPTLANASTALSLILPDGSKTFLLLNL